MYKVSVMYPNQPGSKFDVAYYAEKHMRLVRDLLTPEGLVRTEIVKGVTTGQPAPYHCVGSLYFNDAGAYERGIQKHGSTLRADIANFTGVTPVRLLSEELG